MSAQPSVIVQESVLGRTESDPVEWVPHTCAHSPTFISKGLDLGTFTWSDEKQSPVPTLSNSRVESNERKTATFNWAAAMEPQGCGVS